MLLQRLLQRLALADSPRIKTLDQSDILLERTRRSIHVLSVIVALHHGMVQLLDKLRCLHPPELLALQIVGERIALSQRRHHAVIDEFGIGVQFLGCGQMLAAAQFDPILGVICDLDDKPQHLEIKLVGLVDAQHKILFRNDQRIRLRLEMRIERLDGLDSE